MKLTNKTRTGSCLCGAVICEITGPMRDIVACHCTACRKQSGHFWASASVWNEHFRLTEDRGLKWYHASDHSRRGFCSECGSTMFFETTGSGKISVSGGALDGATGMGIAGHIYTDTKGDYYALEVEIPNYGDADGGAFPMPPKP